MSSKTITEKLEEANNIKEQIRSGIISKEVDVPEDAPFSDYPGYVGQIAGHLEDNREIVPTADGVEVLPNEGYDGFRKVTVPSEPALVPNNIAKGTTIFGVEGNANLELYDAAALIMKTISGTITDPRVTKVCSSVFWSCVNLTGVSFPACTLIQNSAFGFCKSLTEAIFPICTSIGSSAFCQCSKLSKASFPACTFIGSYAFSYCSGLTEVSFPACKTIGSYAFYNCISLTEAIFPICTSIGSSAFCQCSKLSKASFPACTSIGAYAFCQCSKLSKASFPACTFIGSYAFSYCSGLTEASFPACTTIDSHAFRLCNRLISLFLLGSIYATLNGSYVFYSTPIYGYSTIAGRYGSIYVRESMLADYKTRIYWSYFSSRFVGLTDEEIAALDAAQEETT